MALLKCPECNKEVSEFATSCPNCGCPIEVIKNKQEDKKPERIEGHLYSIINGEEKDVTYFVEKVLSKTWGYDILGFKKKMYDELDILNMPKFIDKIEECNGAPEEYNDEKASEYWDNYWKKKKLYQANLPKCPTCHSTKIAKIGTGERVASVIGLGLLSKKINKTWKCKNCGYTW